MKFMISFLNKSVTVWKKCTRNAFKDVLLYKQKLFKKLKKHDYDKIKTNMCKIFWKS